MKFGELSRINPVVMTSSLPQDLYSEVSEEDLKIRLSEIITLFSNFTEIETDFICFVEEGALQKFESFANEIYQKTHNEATGLLVGYYLTPEGDSQRKFLIATDFLPARGNASSVTCEFSYEDSIQHSLFCEKSHVLPIIWVHSHPGFGVFYSSTDSTTLASFFARDHQMGIVVDNLQNKYLGFKIIKGQQRNQDVYSFNLRESITTGSLKYKRLNESLSVSHEKKNAVSFKTITTKEETKGTNQPVSFQLLQKISNQLDFLNSDKFVNRANRVISDLSNLVEQLNRISQDKHQASFGNFTLEDMRKELTTQITNLLAEFKNQFDGIIEEISSLKELELEVKRMSSKFNSFTEKNETSDLPKGNGIVLYSSKKETYKERFLKYCRSIKSAFNLRDLIFIILLVFLILTLFIKLNPNQ